jgi:membrane associated rhomboid family serine protease
MTTDDDSRLPPYGTAVAGPGVSTCYRHPKREAHIRCVRCDRAICPDCMIPASVGFQCPECVRGGRQSQRPARTAFGGRAVAHNALSTTYVLIGINVAMMLVELVWKPTVDKLSILPALRYINGQAFDGIADGQYYRLLTGMFLHANPLSGGYGITHILFNMWALYVVGPPLERWLGRLRFVVLYLLAGLFSSAFVYLLAKPNSETVGASGAIFALFAALFVLGRRLRYDIRPIAGVIVANIVITFLFSGISWQGHIGGLIAGGALSAAWAYAPRKWRTPAQVASSLVLVVVIVAIVVARTHALTSCRREIPGRVVAGVVPSVDNRCGGTTRM